MTKLKNKLFAAILLVCLMLATVVAGFLCISPQIVSASSPQTDTYHRICVVKICQLLALVAHKVEMSGRRSRAKIWVLTMSPGDDII